MLVVRHTELPRSTCIPFGARNGHQLFGFIVIAIVSIAMFVPLSCSAISSSESLKRVTIDVNINNDASVIQWNGYIYYRQASHASSESVPLSSPLLGGGHEENESEWMSPSTGEFWMYASIVLVLVALAGTMSGLTVGLLSVTSLEINILRNDPSGNTGLLLQFYDANPCRLRCLVPSQVTPTNVDMQRN
jgi:hypothetical protein